MLKKVCSVILVFALVVSGITYGNGRVNEASASVYEDIYTPGYTCLYIQPCGDNCSLYAYKDGICVVRGSGPMWDDFEVDDEILSGTINYPGMRYLTFEDGITNISSFNKDSREGYYAEIPEGVKYLRDYAFANSNIIDIVFDGVPEIGKAAFMNCTSLINLYFPNGITTLREHLADGCTSLKRLYIPSSVTTLYGSAFIHLNGYAWGTVYYGGANYSELSATYTPFLDEDGTYYYDDDPEAERSGRMDFIWGEPKIYFNQSSAPDHEDDVLAAMQEVAHNRVLGINDEYPFETPAEEIIGTIEDILNTIISSATFTTDNKYSVSGGTSGSYGTSNGSAGSTSNIGSTSSGTSNTGGASGSTSVSYSTENTHADAMDNAFNNTSIKTAKKTAKKLTINVKKATYEYSNVSYNVEVYKTKKAAKKGKKPIATKKSSSKKIIIKSKKVNKTKKVFVKVRASRPYTASGKTKTTYGSWSKIKKVTNKKAK